jgi:CO/xanthine dehydrogenase Mo-binding subunit
MSMRETGWKWIGQPVRRLEDRRLTMGRGTFVDDIPVGPAYHLAILRSPYAHATIKAVRSERARGLAGVAAVLTGDDVARRSRPFGLVVKEPIRYYCLAVDRARFVGEPVAAVIAEDRYAAEDALEFIEVDYEPLEAVVDPERALAIDAPVLHPLVGSNIANHRLLSYGDVDAAFREADLVVSERFRFPKYASTPLEGYAVAAAHNPGTGVLTLWANFQGPFIMHAVVAGALGIAENRLRVIVPPDIGGAFGIKTSMCPYMTLVALAALDVHRPVKWIETRREHLLASSSGADRVTYIKAAVTKDGRILGLRQKVIDNVGGYLRTPEPACPYVRMSSFTGPYRIRGLEIDGQVVMTNVSPTGPNRGYGGQQLAFSLVTAIINTAAQGQGHETAVAQVVAEELGVRPQDITVVAGMDTFERLWSITTGTYSSRFSATALSAIVIAARRLREKILAIASHVFDVPPSAVRLEGGQVIVAGDPEQRAPLRHIAGLAHWNQTMLPPGMDPGLRVTHVFNLPTARPPDEQDRVNSQNIYGFATDVVMVEIDRDTGAVDILKYVTVHDSGTIINPLLVEGQLYGGFAHGLGGALYEQLCYDEHGQLLTGSFMDYCVPTASQVLSQLDIGHLTTPSPLTPLGAKGCAEATSMSAPAAIANAVSDALRPYGLMIRDLPLSAAKVWNLIQSAEPQTHTGPTAETVTRV